MISKYDYEKAKEIILEYENQTQPILIENDKLLTDILSKRAINVLKYNSEWLEVNVTYLSDLVNLYKIKGDKRLFPKLLNCGKLTSQELNELIAPFL